MSIKRKGPNHWQIMVSVRVPGKIEPVRKQEQFRGTKTEAECRQADLKRMLKEGGSLAYTPYIRTFGEAVEMYIAKISAEGRCSREWRRKILSIADQYGHLPIEAVPDYFAAWRRNRALMPHRGGPPSASSMNRPLEIIRAVYNYLVALECIQRNPMTKVKFPKYKEKPRDRYLTQEERLRLMNAIRVCKPEMLPLIQYMMLVPCRIGELSEARREQYSPITNTIYIPDSKARIPIHKPVPEEMTEYFRSIPLDCPWLFYWKDWRGNYRPFLNLKGPWQKSLDMAGITDLRIHDLRHISATDLYQAGNSERTIQGVAGWKTAMLSNYYHKDSLRDALSIVFKRSAEPPTVEYLREKTG